MYIKISAIKRQCLPPRNPKIPVPGYKDDDCVKM